MAAVGRGCVKTQFGRDFQEYCSSFCCSGDHLTDSAEVLMRTENILPRDSRYTEFTHSLGPQPPFWKAFANGRNEPKRIFRLLLGKTEICYEELLAFVSSTWISFDDTLGSPDREIEYGPSPRRYTSY